MTMVEDTSTFDNEYSDRSTMSILIGKPIVSSFILPTTNTFKLS